MERNIDDSHSKQVQNMINQIVVFTIDELFYALPLYSVVRVVHIVEITTLPKAPDIISGIINVAGRIIPVIDVRKRFGLASREINADDQLVITDTGKRQIALLVDKVSGIKDIEPWQYVNTKETLPYAEYIRGVAKIEDDLILIYDLEQFLNLNEEMELEKALSNKTDDR
jgi:purine-binding chemotaxis protein CheW